MLLPVIFIFAIAKPVISDNQFMNAVRNLTSGSTANQNQTNRNSNHEDVLKSEISKYFNECQSDLSYDYRHGRERNDEKSHKLSPAYRGDRKRSSDGSENYDGGNIDGYLMNYRDDDNYGRNRQEDSCSESGNNYNRAGERNYRGNGNRGNPAQGNNRGNPLEYSTKNGNERQNYDGGQNRGRDNSGYDYGETGNYPSDGAFGRWKRQSENCVSQCIFGYMDLLDENSMPSETATIKFLQDHMHNDRKRLKLVRDARRCFAKLATAETEDGCDSSKTLAKCLKLDME